MNRALISSSLIAAFALVACDNRPPAVVNVPAPAPAPGPAGPAGPQGDPGKPGGTNVIPGFVGLTVDARAPDAELLDRLVAALDIEAPIRTEPAVMSEEIRAVLRAELERLGVPVLELPSGAGHDAGIVAAAGVPSGMLFVRSLNGGISHNPAEFSSEEDIALAVDALTGALRRLVAESD